MICNNGRNARTNEENLLLKIRDLINKLVLAGIGGGSQIFIGGGPPDNTLGDDGDFYIDNINNDYYLKIGGMWVLQGNFEGITFEEQYTGCIF